VGLEYLAAGRDGHIHHLLVLLQGVKAAAHVPMEVVPRQQVLVDGVGIRVGLLLLVGGLLLLLVLVELLLLLLLACVLLDLDHVLLLLLLPLAHQLLLELVLLHGEIIDALRELGHVAVAVELAVGEHGLQLEFVVPGGSAGGGGQFPLGGQGGPLLLSPDQLIDVHVGSTGGRRNGRGYDWIILKDTVVEGLLQGLCGREETQRGIVYLVAKVHIHQCEEGPFAPLGLLGHLDGLVLLQQIVPLLDDL